MELVGLVGSIALGEIEALIYKISLGINTNLLENKIFIYTFFSFIGLLSSLLITYGLLPAQIRYADHTIALRILKKF